MDLEAVKRVAREAMGGRRSHAEREPGFIHAHGLRTAAMALTLADRTGSRVNRDLLYAGALFHDIGKGAKSHHEAGARITRRLLRPYGTPEEVRTVCRIVREHCRRGTKGSDCLVESRLVQDADILDHLGVIDAWLTIYWSGVHGRSIDEALAYVDSAENLRYHSGMKKGLNFEASRRLADRRLRWESRFFAALAKVQRHPGDVE